MSSFGQIPARCIVRSFRIEVAGGQAIEPHRHSWHQLVYATHGAMEVTTAAHTWLVPSRRAIWVPAGERHAIVALGRTLMQTLYVATRRGDVSAQRCGSLDVSDLLRALIVEIARIGQLLASNAAHRRLAGVLLDQIREAPYLELQLPMPSDDRALSTAKAILADPGSKRRFSALARDSASSERTLARIFVQETGMTLARWRAQARFVQAVRGLAGGVTIGEVASEAGYDSTSAFIAAFKRIFGTTPGRYLNDSGG
jgi:AraC-like DNA-binding protein